MRVFRSAAPNVSERRSVRCPSRFHSRACTKERLSQATSAGFGRFPFLSKLRPPVAFRRRTIHARSLGPVDRRECCHHPSSCLSGVDSVTQRHRDSAGRRNLLERTAGYSATGAVQQNQRDRTRSTGRPVKTWASLLVAPLPYHEWAWPQHPTRASDISAGSRHTPSACRLVRSSRTGGRYS